MTTGPIAASLTLPDETQKKAHSAKDFEALLITQMLHAVRDEGSGWLGSGGDDASDAAFGLGEEQLALAVSNGGGFGLAKVINHGLDRESAASDRIRR